MRTLVTCVCSRTVGSHALFATVRVSGSFKFIFISLLLSRKIQGCLVSRRMSLPSGQISGSAFGMMTLASYRKNWTSLLLGLFARLCLLLTTIVEEILQPLSTSRRHLHVPGRLETHPLISLYKLSVLYRNKAAKTIGV